VRTLAKAGLTAAPLALASLTGCTFYGASFDYPDEAPIPDSATVVVTDKGWDDDDPMRSRQQVIDFRGSAPAALLDFYREAYPASEGWEEAKVDGSAELCLVNRSNEDYTEVLEVFRYRGTRVRPTPGRHLALIHRRE
jgi:hypothetical protein